MIVVLVDVFSDDPASSDHFGLSLIWLFPAVCEAYHGIVTVGICKAVDIEDDAVGALSTVKLKEVLTSVEWSPPVPFLDNMHFDSSSNIGPPTIFFILSRKFIDFEYFAADKMIEAEFASVSVQSAEVTAIAYAIKLIVQQ